MKSVKNEMFTNQQLKDMIIPLFFEQLLVMLVGVADTFVVSYAGEAAVSGVSLVNSFNNIFIYLFTALSSGGAVVVSQYLGRKDKESASESISQLLMVSMCFSVVIGGVILIGREPMLRAVFGKVEPDVMEACVTYLRISAYSYPALAIYNTGAAMYRSVGRTSVTMYISIAANIINVTGNIIGVFVLQAGVAGVAYPSLIARTFSAIAITYLCFQERYGIRYHKKWILNWNGGLQRSILHIAVPNGIESGIFQLVKVALSSVVAMFGTYQIAANGIAQSIWSLAALVSVTMEPVFITVIGQCMGAGDTEQAEYYFKKLLRINFCGAIIWNAFIFALTPLMCMGYAVSNETKQMVIWLVLIHNVFSALVHPVGYPMGKGLRAAGDVRFTTAVCIIASVGVRLILSYLFAVWLNMGVMGIAWAMCLDWCLRAVLFWWRLKSGKWKGFKII